MEDCPPVEEAPLALNLTLCAQRFLLEGSGSESSRGEVAVKVGRD